MIADSTASVAFTGHRTYDGSANELLRTAVAELYACGARRFLSGMAVGFDLAAAEAVVAARESLPDLRLVCVVPFEGQEKRFSGQDRGRYERLMAGADEVVILSSTYHAGCYAVRNNYLTDHAATLVAWYDGSPSGTDYTVCRALRRGMRVLNLCPEARGSIAAVEPTLF